MPRRSSSLGRRLSSFTAPQGAEKRILMKYLISMFILAGILVTLQLTVILAKQSPPTIIEATATTTAPVATTTPPQSVAPVKKTSPVAQNAPVTAPPPIIIYMNNQPPAPAPAPSNPAPQPTPSSAPAPTSAPVATSTPEPTPPPSIPSPTEEEAKPTINLDGVRTGDSVKFTWSATGFRESLQCKANGESVEQNGSITVQSVEPYTLTVVCMGTKTGSRTEKSLTK